VAPGHVGDEQFGGVDPGAATTTRARVYRALEETVLNPCWHPPACTLSTCGNCHPVHNHPDLRGHQPDPAHGHGPPAAEGLTLGR